MMCCVLFIYYLCTVLYVTGQFFHNKPLYVAMAERKEDRKARLQQQFATAVPTPSYTSPSNGYIPATYTSIYYSPQRTNVVPQMPYNQNLLTQSAFPLGPVGTIGTVWRSTGTYFPASTSPTAYGQVTSPVVMVPFIFFFSRNFRCYDNYYYHLATSQILDYCPLNSQKGLKIS